MGIEGKGTVKAVLSGDTVVLLGKAAKAGQAPPELVLTLASCSAPRLARSPQQVSEAGAWLSREFLRKLLIGKEVAFKVEYSVAAISREFGSIWPIDPKQQQQQENVCVTVMRMGMANLKTNRDSNENCQDIEQMTELHQHAQAQQIGIFNPNEPQLQAALKWESNGDMQVEKVFEAMKKKRVKAIVESMRDGSSARIIVCPEGERYMLNFNFAGVQCPRVTPTQKEIESGLVQPNQSAPFAKEAKHFSEIRLLHRDVEVQFEGMDKFNNIYGVVVHPSGKNISAELLKVGLAKINDFTAAYLSLNDRTVLRNAEKTAKLNKSRLWKHFVAPVISSTSTKNFPAKIIEVVSGDCVVVVPTSSAQKNKHDLEKRFFLSSIRAPRLGNSKRGEESANYAHESREFLRSKAIGENVQIQIEYEREIESAGNKNVLVFASIILNDNGKKKGKSKNKSNNLAELVLLEGLAEVIKHRPDESKSEYYDILVSAEEKAKQAKKGLYSNKSSEQHRFTDLSTDSTKAKQYLPFLMRSKKLTGIVQFISSGSRLKIFISKENCLINFVMIGIKCPNPTYANSSGSNNKQAEEFGDEARFFTKENCLQRQVGIEIDDMDRHGTIFGNLLLNDSTNFGTLLLREGLARTDGFSLEKSRFCAEMQNAEEEAQTACKRIWSLASNKKKLQEEDTGISLSGISLSQNEKVAAEQVLMRLSEISSGQTFYVHTVDQRQVCSVTAIEKKMKEFTRANGTTGAPIELKKNVICAGLFENEWNRVKVESVKSGSKEVCVRFIDYGNVSTLPVTKLRPLETALASYPGVAMCCKLAFLKLPSLSEDFGREAAIALNDLAWGSTLTSFVFPSISTKSEWCVSFEVLETDKKAAESGSYNVGERLVLAGLARIDWKVVRPFLKKEKNNQIAKDLIDRLKIAQDEAKKLRINMWQYGDIESDDEDSKY